MATTTPRRTRSAAIALAATVLALLSLPAAAGSPAAPVACVHDQTHEQVAGECVELSDCGVVSFLVAEKQEAPLCADVLNEDGESLVCCPRRVRPDYFQDACIRYLFKESLRPARGAGGPAESVAKAKCREYASVYCYKQAGFPDTTLVGACDLPTPFVMGAERDAELNEIPSMALLGYGGDDEDVTCGGTLISERFVLTAAHCVSGHNVTWVQVGLVDRSNPGPTARTFAVEQVIVHEGYRGADPRGVMYNDIALLKLNASVELDPGRLEVRPACLHTEQDAAPEAGRNATVAGWGRNGTKDDVVQVLRYANLPFVSQEECREDYRWSLNHLLPAGVAETQLCAGKIMERDAAEGDSGGPLLIQASDVYCSNRIVGVVSIGMKRPGGGHVTIFTRVASFVPWIESVVWPQAPLA